jgi:putative drug exporter of the RND superfamily
MFARLGRSVVAHPWQIIAAWVVATVALVALAPSLSDVTNNDQTDFLPSSYESVQAQEIADKAFPETAAASTTIVVKRQDNGALTDSDIQAVSEAAEDLQSKKIPQVLSVVTSPQMVSENKKIALVHISLNGTVSDEPVMDAVVDVREALPATIKGTGLAAGVTGRAAITVDTMDKFSTAEKVVGIVTIVLILTLMLLMFRSPIAAMVPILSVALVMNVSNALIALWSKAFDVQISQELPILLTVVLFGIGTDYILFLLFRYRERLRKGDESHEAVRTAVHKVGEAIASAAGAVIVAFAALALSSFEGFKTMGPSLAIAVACMLMAALTLIPALISLIGPKIFWPSSGWKKEPKGTLSKAAGRLVAKRPALLAGVGTLVLLLVSAGAVELKQSYESIGSPQSGTEAADWYETMQMGFPAGATTPTTVYVTADTGSSLNAKHLDAYAEELGKVKGVGVVQPVSAGPDGQPILYKLDKGGNTAEFDLLLADDPFSSTSMNAVEKQVRETAHAMAPQGTTVKVGGMTSAFVDVRDATSRDLGVILPIAGLFILLILALLLRAALAPLYLMVAVVLGYVATLGATTLAFQFVGDEPGLIFILPMFVYLFVVAIGTDYNILMIARLREEAQKGLSPRQAAEEAVEHTGPSIASAGLILAGTFCALLFSGLSMMVQMGFAVAVGILMAAFVMAMFIVPSVTALVGHAAWWPGHGDAARPEEDENPTGETEKEPLTARV